MTETRWLDDTERNAWVNLSLMQLQLTARLNRELADDGLSFQDYVVLAILSEQPDNRFRVVELGREIGWEKSRMSHHITRMSDRGLVLKERCPTDQRGAFVVITDAGRRAIEQAAPGHVAAVRRLFVDLLSRDQLDSLDSVARTVLAKLAEGD